MGYFYGQWVSDDGTHARVDVLPPASHPCPLFVIENQAMHPTYWLIFADGEEVARASSERAIEAALSKVLAGPLDE